MKSTMKRALSLVLTALMLLMLLPGGMAEEMNTASAPVIPGLSDGGALVSEVLGESAEKTAAELLYDRLMACETIDEINAMLDGLTEEENALLDQFTDEQNAALTTKMEELGAYGTNILLEYTGTITVQDTITTDGCLTVTYPQNTTSASVVSSDETADSSSTVSSGETESGVSTLSSDETAADGSTMSSEEAADSASTLSSETVYTFTWEKLEGSDWVKVERKKVTGDTYNISEDGRSINVALDNGAQQTYRAKVETINGEAVTTSSNSSEVKVDYYSELRNGSFESPNYDKSGDSEHFYTRGTDGLVWQTTDENNEIEFVIPRNNEANAIYWHGVPYAFDGDQCAEINANSTSALYQDVLTVPGSTMYWSLAHLGRSMNGEQIEGTDNMYVLIMSYEEAQGIDTQEKVQDVINNKSKYPSAKVVPISYTWKWTLTSGSGNNGWPFGRLRGITYTMSRLDGDNTYTDIFKYSGNISASSKGNFEISANPWKVHTGSYEVPEGQYLTRYFFVAGGTANDNNSVGNHIDRVWFSTEVPPANPGSISLTIQKTIDVDGWDGMTEEQQNAFKNSISFTTELSDASISGSQMTWVGNVGTYNIQNYSIGSGASKDVTVTETTTSVEGYECTSNSTKWTQNVKDGGVGKAEFTNTYTPSTVLLTITKDVTGNMGDWNKDFEFTVSGSSVATADQSFKLKRGGSKTITVNIGDTITVSEEPDGYTPSYQVTSKTADGTEATNEPVNNEKSVTIEKIAGDTTITFTNTKNAPLDTGVLLDSLPYLLILAVVVIVIVLSILRKRRNDD